MPSNNDMQSFVTDLLKVNLPANYTFHNIDHTLFVLAQVKEIGKHEHCSDEEMKLLCTAALWHDAGYIHVYKGHEAQGCKMVAQYLPDFGYSKAAIKKIGGMIMATKIPQTPLNKAEQILADADLAYLGTSSATSQAHNLFLELQSLNPSLTKEEWNQAQIDFIQQHNYFTRYCKEHRDPVKKLYLQKLITGAG